MTPSSSELLALTREDFGAFIAAFMPGFELAPHVKLIISALERVEAGECRRLLISMPPRHGKSLLISDYFPCWALGRDPKREVMFASYAQEFSEDFGRKVRNRMADPLFKAIFPKGKISDDSAGASRFHTTAGGAYYAIGRGGQATGRGASLLLIDDVLKDAADANSPTILRQLHEWYRTTAFTRLSPNGAVIVIGTRWSESDLIGFLSAEHGDQGWETINLPAIAESGDPLGRPEGAALWPSRFPLETLEAIRRQLGSAAFASLYQGRPTAAEGGTFKRSWWQFYREPPAEFEQIVQSWDTAFKVGRESDYSVGVTLGVRKNGFYVLHVLRDRLEFPKLRATMMALAEQWKPTRVLVEDKASGQSVLQELKQETRLPIVAVKVDTDKVTRASAASALVESGRVFLPEPSVAGWVDTFLDEISVFPNGAHDDQVDALVQALNFLRAGYAPMLEFVVGRNRQRFEEEARYELVHKFSGAELEERVAEEVAVRIAEVEGQTLPPRKPFVSLQHLQEHERYGLRPEDCDVETCPYRKAPADVTPWH